MSNEDEDIQIEGVASRDGAKLSGLFSKTAQIDKPVAKPKQIPKPPPIMVVDEEARQVALNAAMALRDARAAQIAKANSKPGKDIESTVRYVECQACSGPGVWIYGDPDKSLGPNDWASSYKPRGVYWSPQEMPYCQCCFESHKVRRPLRMFFETAGSLPNQIHTGLVCNPRFVRELPRAEYERLVAKEN